MRQLHPTENKIDTVQTVFNIQQQQHKLWTAWLLLLHWQILHIQAQLC